MPCISHILVLVVLNTCIQAQTLLWVLQWDVNGFGASPELALSWVTAVESARALQR